MVTYNDNGLKSGNKTAHIIVKNAVLYDTNSDRSKTTKITKAVITHIHIQMM